MCRRQRYALVLAALALVVSCGGPPPEPCKYARTAQPEHYTGVFQLMMDGVMQTGTLDVSFATDTVSGGSLASPDQPDEYECVALASGTMTFDNGGPALKIAGGRHFYVAYGGGDKVGTPSEGDLAFRAGD
jgi:hypothetical protein